MINEKTSLPGAVQLGSNHADVILKCKTLIGPSGVRALPLAAGINVGGHYFWYWSERCCADGV